MILNDYVEPKQQNFPVAFYNVLILFKYLKVYSSKLASKKGFQVVISLSKGNTVMYLDALYIYTYTVTVYS